MIKHVLQKLLIISVIFVITINIYSQEKDKIFLRNKSHFIFKETQSTFLPVSIGVGVVLYLINPIILYENKRLYAGVTKELSIGFGKIGEHRVAFEYSFVFAGNISHHLRFSYKYDILKKGIEPSNMLQGTSVMSFGAGYFTNFDKQGAFPEITYGYSLRNHRLLLFPHVKLRHTVMFKKEQADITDLSFGIIVGFANPFIDVKIRRNN
ncbi:MAG: hypothetical protein EHM58_06850 [Ignavibacteriae bacterium]|nr:MAG: hypothetical protein EHM58_06850 [Ignavibacteriota bacterium]